MPNASGVPGNNSGSHGLLCAAPPALTAPASAERTGGFVLEACTDPAGDLGSVFFTLAETSALHAGGGSGRPAHAEVDAISAITTARRQCSIQRSSEWAMETSENVCV